ncbi:folate-sensitive fragile site protein Fra10Ac1-domain-containing protein [Ganoderma leucocontextum]|nr:folate-sensitive fragile site protein Fra10Ac1-domain-containing protein [Ganoderma leucocontextum]
MALYTPYSSKGASSSTATPGTTEFDILKGSHKFLREDGEGPGHQLSWDERLAKKYYSSLYREYAVCDLKHYKSGNFALRWRTEEEVISGAGETTCGNTRCPLHRDKFALVKVVLCSKCCKMLMWKRNKEKEERSTREGPTGEAGCEAAGSDEDEHPERRRRRISRSPGENENGRGEHRRRRRTAEEVDVGEQKRRRSSRSRSPRQQTEGRSRRS